MQIDTERNIDIGTRRRTGKRARHKDKIVDNILKLPVKLLGVFPFIGIGMRQEARRITVSRLDVAIDTLPPAFDGLRIAFLTDFHSGPTTPADFLNEVVKQANAEKPDLVLLGGDYITDELEYLPEVGGALRRLHAPMGVLGVLGNHDYWQDADEVHCMLQDAGAVDVTNAGRWLHRDEARIRIAGVGDLWEDSQELNRALDGAKETDTVILLSHNPDYAIKLADPRVKLVLSGHTHGGQMCLPRIGPVITNSRYGRRVVSGQVDFNSFQLYTSRGIGTVVAPMRMNCPPEVVILTLRRKEQ